MCGNNPWPIATLWMSLYYSKLGNKEKALECLEFVVNTAMFVTGSVTKEPSA